jgi:hypothetical protein
MKLITLLLLSGLAFAQTPVPTTAPKEEAISDSQKLEYWKARALLAEAKLREATLEAKAGAISTQIEKACPAVTFDADANIVCPAPQKPEAKKP